MRIGIDARTILSPQKDCAIGVGHYTYQLIKALLKIDQENEYVIFFDFRAREKDVRKFSGPNSRVRFYPFSDYKKYLPGVYNEILTAGALRKERLDILHSTSPISRIPENYSGKTVVTFHDMAIYKIPDAFSKVRVAKEKMVYKLMARKADKIIAVSDSIKNDLQKTFSLKSEPVVIRSGLDLRFFQEMTPGEERVLKRFGIDKKFILFLGTIEPSKNITRLLQAFAKFKRSRLAKWNKEGRPKKKFDYQLVLAGKKGWLAKEYLQIIKDFGLKKDVIFTGYVIGDELLPLFKKSEFFTLPSLYEGFGTTLLEAFATGTPAIVSDISSLRELAGDSAYYVNPIDIDDIAKAFGEFANDEKLRQKYSEKGLLRARKYDWDKVAESTLNLYKAVAGK